VDKQNKNASNAAIQLEPKLLIAEKIGSELKRQRDGGESFNFFVLLEQIMF
jgi:hypothetical protein